MELKWKPSRTPNVSVYHRLSYPHKKTGDLVTGKTQQTWEKRLSTVLGGPVDLSKVENFHPRMVLAFRFEFNGQPYALVENPVEKPRYSEFHLQKLIK